MMRVRIPGGQLTAEQLRAVAGIAKEYGRDLADVTDRQNMQFHWIRIEDVPAIWERLEEVGLSSQQACGDVPRNILGCPVAGLDAGEIIDATAALRATEDRRHEQPGAGQPAAQVQDGDLRLRASSAPRTRSTTSRSSAWSARTARPGFDLWVGGGLSTNPMLGQRLGVFVPAEQVPEVWAGGRLAVPRLRLPPAAQPRPAEVPGRGLGRGAVPRGARDRVPGRRARRTVRPPPPSAPARATTSGVHRQRDGRYYVGVAPHTGRTRARSCGRWPTWPRHTGRAGSGAPSSRSC